MKSTARIRHSDTAHRAFNRLRERLMARASHVVHFKLPLNLHDDEDAQQARRLPAYYQGKLEGIHETLRDTIIRQHAEWRVSWRGQEYSSQKGSIAPHTDAIETGTWHECDNDKGRHVWLGTDRDFYPARAAMDRR